VLNGGKQERELLTKYGELNLRRAVLKVKAEKGAQVAGLGAAEEGGSGVGEAKRRRQREIIPLDEYLGTEGLPFKMTSEAMSEVAYWGQNQGSYAMAEEVMVDKLGVRITDSQIQEVTDYVGKVVYEDELKRVEAFEKEVAEGLVKLPEKGTKKGIFYVMADGAAVNTREKDAAGSTWRENKLAVMFSSEGLRKRKGGVGCDIVKKEYVSYLGGVEEFKRRVFEAAVRLGSFGYEEIVLVSDGAAWIRNMGEELFPGCEQILDFYHLAENIYGFGKYLNHGDSEKGRRWAEPLVEKLREGRSAEVLALLGEYKGKSYGEGVVNPHTYLRNNLGRVDYARYRETGYYIGSGPIESGNKTVVQKRLKQAGMMWNENNARRMPALRAKHASGLWTKCVTSVLLRAA